MVFAMPNSSAALIELVKSFPALARFWDVSAGRWPQEKSAGAQLTFCCVWVHCWYAAIYFGTSMSTGLCS